MATICPLEKDRTTLTTFDRFSIFASACDYFSKGESVEVVFTKADSSRSTPFLVTGVDTLNNRLIVKVADSTASIHYSTIEDYWTLAYAVH